MPDTHDPDSPKFHMDIAAVNRIGALADKFRSHGCQAQVSPTTVQFSRTMD
jgi:hypothetical protein